MQYEYVVIIFVRSIGVFPVAVVIYYVYIHDTGMLQGDGHTPLGNNLDAMEGWRADNTLKS